MSLFDKFKKKKVAKNKKHFLKVFFLFEIFVNYKVLKIASSLSPADGASDA